MSVAYAMKKRGQKPKGAMMCSHGSTNCEMCHGGGMYAKGGYLNEEQHGVHGPYNNKRDSGQSEAGENVRSANHMRGKSDGFFKKEHNELGAKIRYEIAKDLHKDKLSELRKMKPVGGYADGGMYAKGGEFNAEKEHENAISGKNPKYIDPSSYKMRPSSERRAIEEVAIKKQRMRERNKNEEEKHRSDPISHRFAQGGFVEDEEESGYESMPGFHDKMNMGAMDEDEDMISRIMKQRYSKGGMVSNKTEMSADFEPNDFDDLVKDDDLEFNYTGANSGDEIGNKQEDEDRHDIISRIMKSRKLKDRMPRPA